MAADIAIAAASLLLLQVVVVVVAAAFGPTRNIYLTVIAVSLATSPVAWLAAPWFFPAVGLDGRAFFMLVHLALGGFFFHFMTLPDRSVTLRILVELLLVPSRSLSVAELKSRYSVRTMIESRVEQLAAGQFVQVTPARDIVLLKRGLRFGRFVTAGRALFGIQSAN